VRRSQTSPPFFLSPPSPHGEPHGLEPQTKKRDSFTPSKAGGTNWSALVIGLIAAAALSLALALATGLFSLWMQSIFFFMVTAAVT
jgi:hypothetical protein